MNERNVMDNRCVRPYFERLGLTFSERFKL